ncbi:MAG: protoheme IX farnesyltransferase [Candidatus Omnitrophica bacterium]|nr:protoheme IX farnesyltransferase [Candidatus Omnitrophota bacterium]
MLKIFLELTKLRIASLAFLSTALGFILSTDRLSAGIIFPVSGIFLLACGSSGLNQFQEKWIDALMDRTKQRPIPSKRIKPLRALFISIFLILAGSLTLLFGVNLTALSLGLIALLLYNGVYTYLKRVTAVAVIPGALIGTIPPIVGWVAGGGRIFERQILAIALFFFVWQVPHFWLTLLNYGKEYEKAGLPSLTRVFDTSQLKRIAFIWMLAAAVICLMLMLFGIVNSDIINICLILAGLWLAHNAIRLLRTPNNELYSVFAFKGINLYALTVILLLFIDRLI